MRQLLQSLFGFGWAMSLWTAKAMGDVLSFAPGPMASPSPPAGSRPRPREDDACARAGRLDPSTFIVIGDGLAAGMGDFTLSADRQRASFAAQMAAQMGTCYVQRLIEPPGVGQPLGFARLPVRVPAAMQSTVLERLPETAHDLCDFSVPGLRAADVWSRPPAPPLVWRDDPTQTAINLIVGMPALRDAVSAPLPTIGEAVVRRRPTLAIVALGFDEVLDAATAQDPDRLPVVASFNDEYVRLVAALRDAGTLVVALTIPDPLSTAYFSTLADAAAVLRATPELLAELYGLEPDARITVPGLVEIGNQLLRRAPAALSASAVLDACVARSIASRVDVLNRHLEETVSSADGWVFDLAAWLDCFAQRGAQVGQKRLTGRYLGGFYGLNGCYPGATGHALIANALLDFLNAAFDASFPAIDVRAIVANDPVAMYQAGTGALWRRADLMAASTSAWTPAPDATLATSASASLSCNDGDWDEPPAGRLRLPPGLVQTLPLCWETSYFGEAIRAIDCTDPRDSMYGSCPGLLFNGHVMADSHLRGGIRIRFTPPVNDVTHFEITLPDGLIGDDSRLAAPSFYEFPFTGNALTDAPGVVSSGDLDLATGNVTNLQCAFAIMGSGLIALATVNPAFPRQAIAFPGQYGSAWARFDQRPDGLLDFAFFGSTFLPLGAALGGHPLRLPLPFAGPTLDFASVPARGMVMHPHVCLNTADLSPEHVRPPEVPENTIREYTLITHNSSFGDHFTLNVPELGDATGRSHLIGRVEIQFGPRAGNSVPVLVTLLGPGGLLQGLEPSVITEAFPGRLSLGPLGHDEFLRFPLRTYFLEGVSLLEDPFDISVGAVDLRSGRLLTELLHRGFLDQDVFLALLRIEPRTPRSSFFFRGPARFDCVGPDETLFRLKAHTIVPYPAGFRFPQADLASAFTAGPDSLLDPFLWLQAADNAGQHGARLEGGADDVLASNGDRFSYTFAFDEAGAASFAYANATQEGSFTLHTLSWIDFACARGSTAIDTVTFSGFGVWRKGDVQSVQQISAQISTAPQAPYVGILIAGGAISNVNTKPPLLRDVVP